MTKRQVLLDENLPVRLRLWPEFAVCGKQLEITG
jgi:hypothetical protein